VLPEPVTGALDLDGDGNVRSTQAFCLQRLDRHGVDLRLPALVDAFGLRLGDAVNLPLLEQSIQLGSPLSASAAHLLRPHHVAPNGFQRRDLDRQVLVYGAHSGVAIDGHARVPGCVLYGSKA
jgi:hypothetical protein